MAITNDTLLDPSIDRRLAVDLDASESDKLVAYLDTNGNLDLWSRAPDAAPSPRQDVGRVHCHPVHQRQMVLHRHHERDAFGVAVGRV